jgi:hypothetical protein
MQTSPKLSKCRRCRRQRVPHKCAEKCIAVGCCEPCLRKLFRLFQSLECEPPRDIMVYKGDLPVVRFDVTGTT